MFPKIILQDDNARFTYRKWQKYNNYIKQSITRPEKTIKIERNCFSFGFKALGLVHSNGIFKLTYLLFLCFK